MNRIKLGDAVSDVVTGLSGIVVAQTTYIDGRHESCVQPTVLKDGGTVEREWFPDARLHVEQAGAVVRVKQRAVKLESRTTENRIGFNPPR